MPPIRIRYHEATSPAVSVIRINDPLAGRHRNNPQQHRSHKRQHRLRANKSDFDYDYGPRQDDFEHMRRSIPDKYWGPYNPSVYKDNRDWERDGDDKYYDFTYDSYRDHASEGNYRGKYEPHHPREEGRQYRERYEAETVPPLPLRRPERFESHRRLPRPEYHERGYQSHRPVHDPEYDGGYRYDRRPVGGSYDEGNDINRYKLPGRYDYQRRPQFVQSEIILPDDRYRPLPYLGDPKRKLYEHRRAPEQPVTYRSYISEYRYHPDEHRHELAHYPPYRSDVPDRYPSVYPHLEGRAWESQEPLRVALITNRPHHTRHRKHHIGYCEASPEKSSKYIPTMHYDELRCPHCQDKLQTYQDEVLAYPWTVQTHQPKMAISDAKAY
ncbi:hypothetical protein ElyMa_004611600 [Elysia marginata]|uniref:Uncharacterized protein n=1 Tax=Elysia marginata TaxID=1093978 RepID=A0AAV4I0H2_9GAST|nr:hypothetical protein ElyMa_004611600 [Elysia marginata]